MNSHTQDAALAIKLPPGISAQEEAELTFFLENRTSMELRYYSSNLKMLVLLTALYNIPTLDMIHEIWIPKKSSDAIDRFGWKAMRSTWNIPFLRRGELEAAEQKMFGDMIVSAKSAFTDTSRPAQLKYLTSQVIVAQNKQHYDEDDLSLVAQGMVLAHQFK
jgi:hypothetical protein